MAGIVVSNLPSAAPMLYNDPGLTNADFAPPLAPQKGASVEEINRLIFNQVNQRYQQMHPARK